MWMLGSKTLRGNQNFMYRQLRSTLNANGSWTFSVPETEPFPVHIPCPLTVLYRSCLGAPQRSGPRMPFICGHVGDLEGKGNSVKFRLPPLLLIWTTSEVRGQSPCDPDWKGTPNFRTIFLASPLRQTGLLQIQHLGTEVHTLFFSPNAVLCVSSHTSQCGLEWGK